MSLGLTILSLAPFILFLFLLLLRKTPLLWVSLITMVLVLLSAALIWKIYPVYAYGSVVKGFLVAVDIFFIIFGAIFFLEVTKEAKIIENIGYYLESISKDIRIQVIFLAWFFENFLEGTAGFGTPSTVVAPLLIGLGISPINAVIIALLGNSSSVVFGAAGAPIKIGFAGIGGASVPFYASMINSIGVLVPAFMLWFLTKGKENGRKEFFEALPFAVWAGVAFIIPSILTVSLGQEFPSILGSIIGLGLVLLTTKLGIFVPKVEKNQEANAHPTSLPLLKVFLPYLILIVFLIFGKFVLGSAGYVVPNIIKHTFSYFNPGFAFLAAGLIVAAMFKVGLNFSAKALKSAFVRSIEPFLVIAFMSVMSQVMVASSHNSLGIPSMIDFLAVNVKNTLLPLWAPMVGAFGSFLTGSATISNLMFGNFLGVSAGQLGFSVDKILALTVVGGAAGNMIALGDIITAETVVGLKNNERNVLRGVIMPCLIYILLVGLIGLLFV